MKIIPKKKKERDPSTGSSKDGKVSSSKSPVGKIASMPSSTSSSELSGQTDREKALTELFEGKSSSSKKGSSSSSSTSRDTSRDPASLERKHKELVKKLRVNGVKIIDKVQTVEISQKDVSKVDSSELTVVYYKLSQFGDKIGRDSKNEPEYFFKGLLKMPTAKELEVIAAQENESQPSARDDSEDSDGEEEVEYPEKFTIQLETGGRSSVPFNKDHTVKQGIEKIASSRDMKISEWMFVTLSGQPVDITTPMGKVPGFAIMCVKKA